MIQSASHHAPDQSVICSVESFHNSALLAFGDGEEDGLGMPGKSLRCNKQRTQVCPVVDFWQYPISIGSYGIALFVFYPKQNFSGSCSYEIVYMEVYDTEVGTILILDKVNYQNFLDKVNTQLAFTIFPTKKPTKKKN